MIAAVLMLPVLGWFVAGCPLPCDFGKEAKTPFLDAFLLVGGIVWAGAFIVHLFIA